MTVGSDHHGDLDPLRAEPGDTPGPFSFDQGSPFQPEAKLGEELDGGIEVWPWQWFCSRLWSGDWI